MRVATFETFGRAVATTGQARLQAPSRLVCSVFARARGILAVAAIGLATVAAIIALRILFWAIGHPDQPFFRELAKLWS